MGHEREITLGVRTTLAAGLSVGLLVPFGAIAALVVGKAAGLRELDNEVTNTLHAYAIGHPHWVDLMAWWSLAFDPNVWRVGALAMVIWLSRRQEKMLAWWVVATMTAGGALGGVLKLLFGRHRPDLLDPVARATGFSFPSGHALNAALGAAVFLLVLLPRTRRRAQRVALLVAGVGIPLVTAYSRVALGVHWTSDVVAGLLLGVAVPAVTVAFFQRRRVREDAIG
jgi:membrane-associated phospholipid phosphatase